MARELNVGLLEAETWCERWEQFAERRGIPRDEYFWDSGRGWIDAQRSFDATDRSSEGLRPAQPRMRLAPPIAFARRVDPGFRGRNAFDLGPGPGSVGSGAPGRKRPAGTVADVGNR
jgi:hypothetical protein